jgi:hypothetical protein
LLLILPLLSFLLVFEALRRRCLGAREAFLSTAVVWGLIITATTEVLSLFRSLDSVWLSVCWGAAVLVAAFTALRAHPDAMVWPLKPRRPTLDVLLFLAPIAFAASLTGVIAISGWPNNWDAMAYHLARVAHWGQNRSIAFYPTHILHQLFYPPWAEYATLHLTLLGGEERLANLVQWFSMLGSVVGVSLIAKRLGASVRGQLFSPLFCATLPMGILQASSSQNDYVAAFWLVCLVVALLALRAEPTSPMQAVLVGASLGLALLTKGTAYLFAAPLLALLGLTTGGPGMLIWTRQWALVALVALAINTPHYARNHDLFGSIVGPAGPGAAASADNPMGLANEAFTPSVLASNLARNAAIHIGTPLPWLNRSIEGAIAKWHALLGADMNDPRTTWRDRSFRVSPPEPSENAAGNPIHLLAIVGSVVVLATSWRWRHDPRVSSYGAALLLGFLLFSLLLKWQPLHSRLQLPLFVLWSPIVGLVLQSHARLMALAVIAMLVYAWPFLMHNRSHPLLGEQSVFNTGRIEQYFRQGPGIRAEYIGATSFIRSSGCNQVGLMLGWDDYEYPLWALLPQAREGGRMEHVGVTNSSSLLVTRWPRFTPCAVVVVRGPGEETLELDGRAYQRAWSGGRQADRVEVFVS